MAWCTKWCGFVWPWPALGLPTSLASIVISMFMAGLGLGSWGAGLLARRLLSDEAGRSLRFYAAAELLVGISSVVVPFSSNLDEYCYNISAPASLANHAILCSHWLVAFVNAYTLVRRHGIDISLTLGSDTTH